MIISPEEVKIKCKYVWDNGIKYLGVRTIQDDVIILVNNASKESIEDLPEINDLPEPLRTERYNEYIKSHSMRRQIEHGDGITDVVIRLKYGNDEKELLKRLWEVLTPEEEKLVHG